MKHFTCKQCNKEFDSNDKDRKFCSSSCSSKHNNTGSIRSKPLECANCGDKFQKTKTRSKRYCPTCIHNKIHVSDRRVKDLSKATTDRTRKKILLDINGGKCSICSNDKWLDQKIPLEIDHVDGNPENNTEENLRLICPNCHALTNTYKGKNKGRGRYSRRQRYLSGLSH